VIDIRELWREEKNEPGYDPEMPITRALFAERVDTIVHTEKGTLHCICPVTGEQRDMAFQGFEADRNTLKYRCPAAAYGFQCPGHKECSAFGQVNPGACGRSIRINITKEDRRIFTPTLHGSPSWQRIYNRRSSLERINNRIDNSFGFEKHYIHGKAKMQTGVGLALAVMMVMALGMQGSVALGKCVLLCVRQTEQSDGILKFNSSIKPERLWCGGLSLQNGHFGQKKP
jgi:hypothetical protein